MPSQHCSSATIRAFALTAVAALAILLAPAAAAAAVTPTGTTDTIHIALTKGKLKFVGPATVTQGDELEIVNDTNPRQIGPHTFSLVQRGLVPKTTPQRRNCFTPKRICFSIAKWHGFDAETEEISVNPANAGPPGWSTMGTNRKRGDSWFTARQGDSLSQEVTAAAGATLYFICAVHPWMHGQVEVQPQPEAPPVP